MRILFLILILCSKAWSFQVLQTTKEATVSGSGDIPQEILTGDGDVKIKIGESVYEIFANTQIQFIEGRVVLSKGDLRWRSEQSQSLAVKTPVGVLKLQGTDFVVHYQPEQATASVETLGGAALIQGEYREEVLNVQVGESGRFVGVPEAEGPAFDTLLKNRKAVRGNLQGPNLLTAQQRQELEERFTIKMRPVVKKEKPKPKPGQICAGPFAKFNECVWRCRNNPPSQKKCLTESPKVICLREKCLANGQWGDATILHGAEKQACESPIETIKACNY